jgi:hypothetical protein
VSVEDEVSLNSDQDFSFARLSSLWYVALARRKREPCSASPTLVQALYATRALVRRAHNSLDHQGIFRAAGFFFTLGIFADLAHVAIEEAI